MRGGQTVLGLTAAPRCGVFLRRTRGSTAFSPTDIAGLHTWLKADAGTFQTSGGSAATADGDPVGEWQDQSGNGNHAVQATSSFRPTLQTVELNGLSVIRFDGSDDYLRRTFGASLAQPGTIFVVAKTAASTTNEGKIFDGVAGGRWLLDESIAAWRLFAGGSVITGGTPNDNWNYHTATFNGASSSHRMNGAASFTGNPGSGTLGGITLGADDSGATPLTGDIAEVLIYDSAITGANLTSVESYLASRWGL